MNNPFSLSLEQPTIIYVGDPLCSWCYGFAPELTQVKKAFENNADFKIIMGGLRPNGDEQISKMKSFLLRHWNQVHERTRQPFNYEILNRKDLLYDTEPSCRAVVTMRNLNPKNEFAYLKAIQHLFYEHGKDATSANYLADLASEFGVETSAFLALFESDEMRKSTWDDFAMARELQSTSFPTVLVHHFGQYFMVAKGFLEAEHLIANLKSAISMAEKQLNT